MELQMYKAEVIDTNDLEKQGKIKIKVLPEMEKLEDVYLPWAVPFILKCSFNSLSNSLPEKGSTIRVLIDKYWKRFYYLSNPYFYSLFNYTKVEATLSAVTDSAHSPIDTTYSNIEFNMYEDGGLIFHNKLDGSYGFIHRSGGYMLFDKNGAIILKSVSQPISIENQTSKVIIDSDGSISIESGSSVKISNSVFTLGTLMEELIQDLSSLTTEGTAVSQTSPTLTAQMALLLPKIKALLK